MRMELIENRLTDGSVTYDLDIFDGLTEIQVNMVQTDDLDARTGYVSAPVKISAKRRAFRRK